MFRLKRNSFRGLGSLDRWVLGVRSEVEWTIYELLERHNAVTTTMLSAATGLSPRTCSDYLKVYAAKHPEFLTYHRGILIKKPSMDDTAKERGSKGLVQVVTYLEREDAERLGELCRRMGITVSEFLRSFARALIKSVEEARVLASQEELKPPEGKEEEGGEVAETENV